MAGSFFVVGGTMPQGSSSYLDRRADKDLYQALSAGEFAFVLDSRQKGKSSLMARTRAKLQSDGVQTALLDLQQFGSNVDPDRWYASMLYSLGDQLGMEDELLDLWDGLNAHGPMRRFFLALERALSGNDHAPVVIFVDEVDFVRSLPFSADEFLAGIREVHNRKATGELRGVTFCLLGVAAPWELIRDVRITPFNVGRRIELTDFTLAELAPYATALSQGGRDGEALVKRIHHWTGGHPYLTQKLAAEVLGDSSVRNAGGVDRLVEKSFFTEKAKAEEQNLADVSRRVLESPIEGVSAEEARARVLDLYRQVRETKRTKDDDTDPAVTILKLSGLVGVLEGYLLVRNRIYFKAFDKSWVEANLPEAEALRQKRAASRAAWRVGLVSGGIAACVGLLAMVAFAKAGEAQRASAVAKKATLEAQKLARDFQNLASSESAAKQKATTLAAKEKRSSLLAEQRAKEADTERKKAIEALQAVREARAGTSLALERVSVEQKRASEQKLRAESFVAQAEQSRAELFQNTKSLYTAKIGLVSASYESNSISAAESLLRDLSTPQYKPYRSIELDYWNHKLNTHLLKLVGHTDIVTSSSFSPNGKHILTSSNDGTARLWDAASGECLRVLKGHKKAVNTAFFSPDGTRIVTASDDFTARVWDLATAGELFSLVTDEGIVHSAAFSPDGQEIVTATSDGLSYIWDVQSRKRIAAFQGRFNEKRNTAATGSFFSPDGSKVVTTYSDSTVIVWNATDISQAREILEIRSSRGSFRPIRSATFSPDGKSVFSFVDGVPKIWDLATKRERSIQIKGLRESFSAAYSPDGTRIATASYDGIVRVTDSRTGENLMEMSGHNQELLSVAFSPDGRRIVSASADRTARTWDASVDRKVSHLMPTLDREFFDLVSPDGSFAAMLGESSSFKIIDTNKNHVVCEISGIPNTYMLAAFSKDSSHLAAIDFRMKEVVLWETRTGRRVSLLRGHKSDVLSVAFSPDSCRVITINEDFTASVWESKTGKKLFTLQHHKGLVWSASFSKDGTLAITSCADGGVRIWDCSSGKLVSLLRLDKSVRDAFFHPDSRKIVTLCDGQVSVWQLSDFAKLCTLVDQDGPIQHASVSVDGKRIVTFSFGGGLKVWDCASGAQVTRIESPKFFRPARLSVTSSFLILSGYRAKNYTESTGFLKPEPMIIGTTGFSSFEGRGLSESGFQAGSQHGDNLVFGQGESAYGEWVPEEGIVSLIPFDSVASLGFRLILETHAIAHGLYESDVAGDSFAWNWQVRNWLTSEAVTNSEVEFVLANVALFSKSIVRADSARSRLVGTPVKALRKIYAAKLREGEWDEAEKALRWLCQSPASSTEERKYLALLVARRFNHASWVEAARSCLRSALESKSAVDLIHAAQAVRILPGFPDDLTEFRLRLDKLVVSNRTWADSLSPMILLYRAGLFDEARRRLEASDPQKSRLRYLYLALIKARLGDLVFAKQVLQASLKWVEDGREFGERGYYTEPWEFRLEFELVLEETRHVIAEEEKKRAGAMLTPRQAFGIDRIFTLITKPSTRAKAKTRATEKANAITRRKAKPTTSRNAA